jgi:hypothetical protein
MFIEVIGLIWSCFVAAHGQMNLTGYELISSDVPVSSGIFPDLNTV